MTIELNVVEHPPEASRKGPRESVCRDIVSEARKHYPSWIHATASSADELMRLYKASIQYRIRHQDKVEMEIRKVAGEIFFLVKPPAEGGAAGERAFRPQPERTNAA